VAPRRRNGGDHMSDDRHRLRFGLWYFDLNEVKITPAPIQRPHPPIWLGGFTPAALRRAVRYGDGFSVPDANRDVYDRYVAELTKEHRPTDNVRFASGFQWLSVSNDPEATFNEAAADHILLPGQQLYGVALESWPRVRAGISPGPRALATERPSQGRRARYGDNHDSSSTSGTSRSHTITRGRYRLDCRRGGHNLISSCSPRR